MSAPTPRELRAQNVCYILDNGADSWAPGPGEEILAVWRGLVAQKSTFLRAWQAGESPAECAARCEGGAIATEKAQTYLEQGLGLVLESSQWADVPGAADDPPPPKKEHFWQHQARAPPRCLLVLTDGLGARDFAAAGGVHVYELCTALDSAIAIGPKRAAEIISTMQGLGAALVAALRLAAENAIPVSKEVMAACVAAWKYGAPIALEILTQLGEWMRAATSFLLGLDYVGAATTLYQWLAHAAQLGIELAKFLGPIALEAARQAVEDGVELADDVITTLAEVDWEKEAAAAYVGLRWLASRAKCAARHARAGNVSVDQSLARPFRCPTPFRSR
jgi:hypothetical protein